ANEWEMAADAYRNKDYTAALSIWQRLAEEGNGDAQYAVGVIHYKGLGVRKDIESALEWFQKAADHGHPEAMFNLGVAAWEGKGLPKSYATAVKWWKEAAAKGNSASQYNLGLAYSLGKGAERDDDKAQALLASAADSGHAGARRALPALQSRIATQSTLSAGVGTSETLAKDDVTTPTDTASAPSKSNAANTNATKTSATDDAQDYTAGIISAETASLRTAPKHSATVLDILTRGTPIKIVSAIDGWAQVDAPAGSLVWVFGKYVAGHTDQATIRGAGVRARSKPATGAGSTVITKLKTGERVRVLKTAGKWKLIATSIKTWLPTSDFEMLDTPTKSWHARWVSTSQNRIQGDKRSTRPSTKTAPVADTVDDDNIGQKPRAALVRTPSSEVLGMARSKAPMLAFITRGTPVRVLSERGAYVSVQIPNGLAVWVYGKLITDMGKIAVVNTPNVRARSMPSTGADSQVLGQLRKGQKISIISRQGEWTRLRALNSVAGWMRRDQLDILDTVTAEWTEKWSRARASIRQ
ncbi:MAG: SH3 domain-containing protein, partial [Arenicellales bacterium]|nr:SH3 domain-containing protein [Arenicellales bacterium]